MCTFSYILEKSGLTKAEFARALGIPQTSINTRIKGTDDIRISELEKIEKYVGRKLYRAEGYTPEYDQVAIPYLEGYPILKHPKVKERVQFDREIIDDVWCKKAENLRIITMRGNNMNHGEYRLKNNDILIIDISITTFNDPGIYAYTTEKTNGVSVSGLQEMPNGNLRIINCNKDYQGAEYTPAELAAMGFNVIGRMVKNVSLTK